MGQVQWVSDIFIHLKLIFLNFTQRFKKKAICNPTDVVKIRFQSNQVEYRNKNVFTSLVHIYQNEGFKGLYRGMFTNAQYTAIVTAAELASYDSTKQFLIKKLNFDDNTGAHLT